MSSCGAAGEIPPVAELDDHVRLEVQLPRRLTDRGTPAFARPAGGLRVERQANAAAAERRREPPWITSSGFATRSGIHFSPAIGADGTVYIRLG